MNRRLKMWTFIKELLGIGLTNDEQVTPPTVAKVEAKTTTASTPELKEVETKIAEAIKAEAKPAKKAKAAAPKAKVKNTKKNAKK